MNKKSFAIKRAASEVSLWKTQNPLLGRLDIELTERCNNNCTHCCINLPSDDQKAKSRELSTNEVQSILKEAADLGCMTVRYTGGEPLLREDFEELYVFARKLGLKVMIFTNATLITPHLARLFARMPPLEKIEVTVYGMHKDSYEAVSRVPGSYEAAWRGINLLLEHNIPFVVKGTLLPPNQHELDEFESWASSLPGMDKPPTYSMFFDLRSRRDSEKKNRLIQKLRTSPEEGVKVLTRNHKEFKKNMQEFASKFMSVSGENLFSCGAGAGGGCVDAYGMFQPCMLLRHPDTTYNLKTGSLKEALTKDFKKLRKRKAENPEYIMRCARCFLKGLCEQCPAKSWMEFGTLDNVVEYLCEVAHAQARYLGLLEADEKAWEVTDWKERIKKFAETLKEK